MNTTIGSGKNSVRDFAIDLTDKEIYIGGHSQGLFCRRGFELRKGNYYEIAVCRCGLQSGHG